MNTVLMMPFDICDDDIVASLKARYITDFFVIKQFTIITL